MYNIMYNKWNLDIYDWLILFNIIKSTHPNVLQVLGISHECGGSLGSI